MQRLSLTQLVDQNIFDKIFKQAQDCERFSFQGEYGPIAYQIILTIDNALQKFPQLKSENPEIYKKYNDLNIHLKFHCQEYLPDDNDVLDLYEKHLADALKRNMNLERWLRNKLISMRMTYRDEYVNKIKAIIKKNQQKIGEKEIIISNKKYQPTIENWIKDYEYEANPGIHSLVERNNYFFQSKNPRNLNEQEKKELKKLLQLFDRMQLKITDAGSLTGYSASMYGIELKKTVDLGAFTTKEQEHIDKGIKQPASSVKPIPFPTKKTEQREKLLAENKKLAEREMLGVVDIKKLQAAEPSNRFIASIKRIGKPIKKTEPKIEETKVIKAVPEKEVVKEIAKPKTEELPNPPKKVFHKEHKILTPAKPVIVSKQINRIQNLTILEFRDLGTDAKQSAQKLLNNLRDIAKTHEERKIAQENFMKSPLYKLYEAMTNQSETEKKSISQVSKDRQDQKMEYLSEDEYIAVKSISKLI
ncbi:MAG: hypothetical protein WC663_00945 [Patescibacteria group bacterium]|jgi:hypothetical protein